jgi:HEAT repeat protein/beta-lactamase regulating signal transducer with metallopeptidase domain
VPKIDAPAHDGTKTEQETVQRQPAATPAWSIDTIVVGIWSSIAGLLLLGFGFRRWQLARRLGGRALVRNHPAVGELTELSHRSGLRRPIVLTVCDRLSSPIVVGLSEVSVPGIALRELDGPQRRSMLAHELAHLVRFDPAWLSIAALIERVFFFQPLNRLARRRIQADAELLCDAWAAEQTGSGLTLAKCLVRVAEWIDAAPRPIPIAGMAEERSQLVDRVRRLVEEKQPMWNPRRPVVLVAIGACLLITAFVAPRVALVGQDPPQRPTPTVDGGAPSGSGPRTMGGVIASLGKSRGTQDTNSAVVPALLEALKDDNAEVRRAAAQSLGNIGDKRATNGLVAVLGDEDAHVREAAVEALGELEDPRSINGLASRLTDSVTEVRRAVVHALSRFENKVSADVFRPVLADEDPEIRAHAANAVGELKDHASAAALTRLIGDKHPDVRRAALSALSNLELEALPAAVLDALRDPNADVRQAAASLVGEAGDVRAVPSLKGMLADNNADVREAAVNALSEIRDAAAIDALVAALKSSDPVVRKAAAEALGQRHEQ